MATTPATIPEGARSTHEPDDDSYDPLAALRDRLERARNLTDAPPETAVTRDGGDPLETLQRRVSDASDPAQWAELLKERARTTSGPLAELFQAIDRARLSAELSLPPTPDTIQAHLGESGAEANPLVAMGEAIADERDDLGARREPLTQRRTETTSDATDTDAGSSEIATELLDAIAARPLSGEVRAQLARRLASLADARDSDELRELLNWVVQDDIPET